MSFLHILSVIVLETPDNNEISFVKQIRIIFGVFFCNFIIFLEIFFLRDFVRWERLRKKISIFSEILMIIELGIDFGNEFEHSFDKLLQKINLEFLRNLVNIVLVIPLAIRWEIEFPLRQCSAIPLRFPLAYLFRVFKKIR